MAQTNGHGGPRIDHVYPRSTQDSRGGNERRPEVTTVYSVREKHFRKHDGDPHLPYVGIHSTVGPDSPLVIREIKKGTMVVVVVVSE